MSMTAEQLLSKIQILYGSKYWATMKLKKEWEFDFSKQIFDDLQNKKYEELKWIIIWEAPGKDEVLNDKPFCGEAGRNLFENVERNNFYVTNILKYRPTSLSEKWFTSNRTPTPKEITASSEFFMNEIIYLNELNLNFRFILLVGNTAYQWFKNVIQQFISKGYLVDFDTNISDNFDLNAFLNKKQAVAQIVNKRISFKITGHDKEYIFHCFIIYHTSPFNYNFESKKNSIKAGIKLFLESCEFIKKKYL